MQPNDTPPTLYPEGVNVNNIRLPWYIRWWNWLLFVFKQRFFIQMNYVRDSPKAKQLKNPAPAESFFAKEIYKTQYFDLERHKFVDSTRKAQTVSYIQGALLIWALKKEYKNCDEIQFSLITVQDSQFINYVTGQPGQGPISESKLKQFKSTGWSMGACHYTITDKYAVRCTDNGKFWLVTNKASFDVIRELTSMDEINDIISKENFR